MSLHARDIQIVKAPMTKMAVAGLLYLTVIAAITNALSSHPYYRDYLHKRADECVEKINNLLTLFSKLSADDGSRVIILMMMMVMQTQNPT